MRYIDSLHLVQFDCKIIYTLVLYTKDTEKMYVSLDLKHDLPQPELSVSWTTAETAF